MKWNKLWNELSLEIHAFVLVILSFIEFKYPQHQEILLLLLLLLFFKQWPAPKWKETWNTVQQLVLPI